MGFFEDISATLNRGANATAKTANTLKLKAQIADLNSQRRSLCSGLGGALYDRTKDDPEITSGLEEFYDGIANCDKRILELQHEIDRIESAANPGETGSFAIRICPSCGYALRPDDAFCGRCGESVHQQRAAHAQKPGPFNV